MHLTYIMCLFFMIAKIASSGNKYYISPNRETFLQALSCCRRINMKLVTIDSEDKNLELYKYFAKVQERFEWFWIGGIYQNSSLAQEWYWLEADKEFTYTDWRQDEPPPEPKYYSEDNCLRWGYHDPSNVAKGLWRVDNCESMYRYVCEQPYSDSCQSI